MGHPYNYERLQNFSQWYLPVHHDSNNEQLLSDADFETDTTYNENTELTYRFNGTVFDYNTMKWAVARIRSNEEDAEFYKLLSP